MCKDVRYRRHYILAFPLLWVFTSAYYYSSMNDKHPTLYIIPSCCFTTFQWTDTNEEEVEETANIQCLISTGTTPIHYKRIYKVYLRCFCQHLCYLSKVMVPDVQMEDILGLIYEFFCYFGFSTSTDYYSSMKDKYLTLYVRSSTSQLDDTNQ